MNIKNKTIYLLLISCYYTPNKKNDYLFRGKLDRKLKFIIGLLNIFLLNLVNVHIVNIIKNVIKNKKLYIYLK